MTVIIPVTEQSRAIWDSWQDKCNVFTLTFGVPRSDDVRNWMSRDILDQSAVWTCQCPANERFSVRRIMFLSLQDHWVWHRVSSGGGIRWIWTFLEFKTFYQGPTFISSDIDNEIMPGRVFANIRSVKLANKVQGDFLPTTLQLWNSCVRKCCFVICCAPQLTSVVTGWERCEVTHGHGSLVTGVLTLNLVPCDCDCFEDQTADSQIKVWHTPSLLWQSWQHSWVSGDWTGLVLWHRQSYEQSSAKIALRPGDAQCWVWEQAPGAGVTIVKLELRLQTCIARRCALCRLCHSSLLTPQSWLPSSPSAFLETVTTVSGEFVFLEVSGV